jgi:hypothetical protein
MSIKTCLPLFAVLIAGVCSVPGSNPTPVTPVAPVVPPVQPPSHVQVLQAASAQTVTVIEGLTKTHQHFPKVANVLAALRKANPSQAYAVVVNHNAPVKVGVIYILKRASNKNTVVLEQLVSLHPREVLITKVSKSGKRVSFILS